MKLSKAQQRVIDEAKEQIDVARMYNTFEEYFDNYYGKRYCNSNYNTSEKYKERDLEKFETLRGWWEERINGIVYTSANSKTLYKLEQLGLIEIIYDAKNESYGIDNIKILNY